MASRTPRWRWPWYSHVLLVLACVAAGLVYTWLKPTQRQGDIALSVILVVLAALITAIQVQNRRKMSKRDGGPPRDDATPGGPG